MSRESVSKIVLVSERNLIDRRAACKRRGRHGPWLRVIAKDFSRPFECCHCGTRAWFTGESNPPPPPH